jgi:uncharacterized protein YutE (UPF0331/DUF86 family)
MTSGRSINAISIRLCVLDRERILAKLAHLEGYLQELHQLVPTGFNEYLENFERRRACERLLQISIECMLDICALLVSGLRLGLPGETDDLLEKLERAKVFSSPVINLLRTMKGFRNILVHEYVGIDNAIVYKVLTTRLEDFGAFKSESAQVLRTKA